MASAPVAYSALSGSIQRLSDTHVDRGSRAYLTPYLRGGGHVDSMTIALATWSSRE